ncbi:helix-turn-helix domain-containing protein [Natrinema hispanicum]|uniref:Winged helix-turn-helix DNA-binding n=1 Tax=Natrinema hispanicum TaxID=392421 RepID=A0A1G6UDI9_9EURY|nr:helix-turn-helix domain-containing protein [Natrinema hispanicum]SDD39383.1 Winged helix-turn-helix DNA-binding [Natrinema hispanicum]SET96750.1 Winged helix-turn-helix DNA-binding [Natrinema hispanicum]
MSATESDSDEVVDADDPHGECDGATIDADLPPSAKLIYKVLEYEAPLTQEELAAESRLCPRTVRYALGRLEEQGVVTSRACLADARQSKYRIDD